MANSTLELTFVSIPSDGETLDINLDIGVSITRRETFKTLRIYSGQTTIGGTNDEQATYYTTAWNLDHSNTGTSGNLLATRLANVVTITLLDKTWQFDDPTGDAITNGDVTFIKTNVAIEYPKVATFVDFDQYASDKCNYVYANYTVTGGDSSYDVYVDGALQLTGQTSPIAVLLPRGVTSTIKFQDSTGTLIKQVYKLAPAKVLASQITATPMNLSGGVSITITVDSSANNEPYNYSLTNDGLDWQVSNVFSGLAAGSYTVYVQDVFECVTASDTVVLDGITEVTETIVTISEINALRFALLQENAKKNHKNTLSCGENKQIHYPFYHRFLSTDDIKTQFKTNAQYINIYTLDTDRSINTLTPTQLTENTGLEAKSTSTYFDLGGGKSGIYFGVVDILNVVTDAVEDTVDFGFTLPEWADSVGKIVNIEDIGDVAVAGIEYSDTYDSFILSFDVAYTGSPVSKKLYSLYNLQPYEVYEVTIDMASESASFNLVMEFGSDSDNIDYTYVSEMIKLTTDSDDLFEIVYWDDENRGNMVYQTGITHTLRLYGMQDYIGFQELEGYDGDDEHYVTKDTVFDAQKFWFFRLSSEMAHKMRLVTGHKYLKINGIYYKISELPEIKTTPTSNFKTFSVILKRNGDQFLTDEQELITTNESAEAILAGIEAVSGSALILSSKT